MGGLCLFVSGVAQVLSAEYETVFRDGSHGFRPKRSCSTAMDQALAYANDGYVWVVDVDLAQFFYTVSHGKLLQVLSKRVKDRWVVKLVHKMLRAPVSENGVVEKREIGTPQGGPVCPVLANIRASRTRCRVGVAEPQVCPLRRRPHGAVSKQEGRRAHDRAPQALHRRKALPADQCREDEDLPHHGPRAEVPWFRFLGEGTEGRQTPHLRPPPPEVAGEMQGSAQEPHVPQSRTESRRVQGKTPTLRGRMGRLLRQGEHGAFRC